jgi:1-pyrroline-5-carboxylate dehydrogenase
VATAVVRGGYEFQGQKCSALISSLRAGLDVARLARSIADTVNTIRHGDVADFSNFMGGVIDANAFAKISGYSRTQRSRLKRRSLLAATAMIRWVTSSSQP